MEFTIAHPTYSKVINHGIIASVEEILRVIKGNIYLIIEKNNSFKSGKEEEQHINYDENEIVEEWNKYQDILSEKKDETIAPESNEINEISWKLQTSEKIEQAKPKKTKTLKEKKITEPKEKCQAKTKLGDQCKKNARVGQLTCATHIAEEPKLRKAGNTRADETPLIDE